MTANTNVVVTATTYQANEGGKALATGVGFRVDSTKKPNAEFVFKESDEHKYAALLLVHIQMLLERAKGLGEHDSIRFITGMPDVAGVLRKLNRAFVQCLQSKVTTEEQVDRIVRRISNYERRPNHELYVAAVVEAVVLSNNGVNVEFYPDYIRTEEHGNLWAEVRNRVRKSPSLKNSS